MTSKKVNYDLFEKTGFNKSCRKSMYKCRNCQKFGIRHDRRHLHKCKKKTMSEFMPIQSVKQFMLTEIYQASSIEVPLWIARNYSSINQEKVRVIKDNLRGKLQQCLDSLITDKFYPEITMEELQEKLSKGYKKINFKKVLDDPSWIRYPHFIQSKLNSLKGSAREKYSKAINQLVKKLGLGWRMSITFSSQDSQS